MTAVPLPGISRFAGQEVGCSLVLHSLRKSQQNPGVVILSVAGGTGDNRRRGGFVVSVLVSRSFEANLNIFFKTLNQPRSEKAKIKNKHM